jgi:hypothetical protein
MNHVRVAWMTATVLALAAPGALAGEIDKLGWMAGSWASDSAGVRIEEHWAAPLGGTMIGMHREVKNGRASAFEFFRIVESDSGIVYLASPGGRPATPFPLKTLGERSVVFENPAHDFPARILYWLDETGSLQARAEGTIRGEAEAEAWRWSRTTLTGTKTRSR